MEGKPSIGDVIFVAFKPIAKMAGIALGGAIFARTGVLTPEVCKANATLVLNFLLPLLMFSTVVPAFEPENMKTVLALVITAAAYMTFGLAFGFVVRAMTPVPRGWSGGVLACGAFNNWGDLPLAFLGTIAKSAPFDGDKDISKGMAYVSIFMVSQMFVLYNMGGIQLIAHDFKDRDIPDLESTPTTNLALRNSALKAAENTKQAIQRLSTKARNIRNHGAPGNSSPPTASTSSTSIEMKPGPKSSSSALSSSASSQLGTTRDESPQFAKPNDHSVSPAPPGLAKRAWIWFRPFINNVSVTLAIGLVIANVVQLKALFVHTKQDIIPNAPDDKPPLDFVMEICKFGGDTTPVIGMVLLGAALSRLSVKNLPKGFWKSVVLMGVLKLVVGSIIGVAWSGMMVNKSGLVDADDKILHFVMILVAGSPAATSLIYITNTFAPASSTTELSALSAMLLAQYMLMLVSLTVLVVYTLLNVL